MSKSKSSIGNRNEGTTIPCCEVGVVTGSESCTKRLYTDWRPDYQKYMCNACVAITPSPLTRILAVYGRSRRRRATAGHRTGEFCGVEEKEDFYSSSGY